MLALRRLVNIDGKPDRASPGCVPLVGYVHKRRDLLNDPGGSIGRAAVVDSIAVATGLGQGAFALALSETTSYPVLLSPDAIQRLRAANTTLYGGDLVFVRGRVYTLNDSIRGAWVNSGAVDAGMAENIPIGPSFLLADSVFVY